MITSCGKYSYGINNIKVFHWGEPAKLHIGSFCSIAENCIVYLGGNHRTDWITTYPFGHVNKNIFDNFDGKGHPSTNGDVVIGNDVWIGNNATIMSGITIGDGAVIAANSHVVKNIDPYTIVGGNPARPIKQRFSKEIIDKLLEIEWWSWPDQKINIYLPYLCSDNINELITLEV
jgi:acetyltransferase-like isoleucine patch superfamily enzyme